MADTPLRRSARLTSAPRSVAARSTAAPTPSKGPAKKGPLPKVKVAQSHAYGSTGRLGTAADLTVPSTGFAQAFSGVRETALGREGPRGPDRVEQLEIEASSLDVSKSFGNDHEAGMADSFMHSYQAYTQETGPRHIPSAHEHDSDSDSDDEEGRGRLNFWETLRDNLPARAPQPPSWLMLVAKITAILLSLWALMMLFASNSGLASGLDRARSFLPTSLSGAPVADTLERFTDGLPPFMAAKKGQGGKLEIPDQFWQALLTKIKNEGLGDLNEARDEEWIDYLDKNNAVVQRLWRDKVEPHVDGRLKQFEIIERKNFASLLQKDYDKLSRQIDLRIKEGLDKLSKEQKAIIQKTVKDVAAKAVLDQVRLESMAYSNIVANTEIALKTINWYSPLMGARVVPKLTTRTYRPEPIPSVIKSFFGGLYMSWMSFPQQRPPVAALEKWDEAGECWCAPPSNDKGAINFGVDLGRPLQPARVTIEHIPKEGTPEPGRAPKEMELWGLIKTEHDYRELQAELNLGRLDQPDCHSYPDDGENRWVCLGKFSYNIHGHNHVQSFDLDLDLSSAPNPKLGVTRTALRVNDNWGAEDWTCLYRVRLNGKVV